jgi:hypothetical protein
MNQFKFIRLSLSVVLYCVCGLLFSQSIEGGDIKNGKHQLLRKPMAYDMPTGKTIEGEDSKRSTRGEARWTVYSDREDNDTYFDKKCIRKNTTLHFMDCFVVAQETDDAVRLVRFDPVNQPFVEKSGSKKGELVFKSNAEDVGWIKKTRVLLWSSALVNDSTKYTQKAISVKKLENGSNSLESILKKGRGILDLFTYPDAGKRERYAAGKDITLFQYLFVLKSDPATKMLLVAKEYRITPSGYIDEVLGWAPENQLQIWDNAVCLRINFDDAAVQERQEKNIKVQFFRDINGAKAFRDNKPATPLPFIYEDPSDNQKRNDNPYFYGFPIVDKNMKEPNIYKTGYVTQTVDKNGKTIFSANKQAVINEQFEEIKKSFKKINILFLIDGSQRNSMKIISKALGDIALLDDGSNTTKNTYKMGAVIYNDAKCTEDGFKTISLTNSKDTFIDKLMNESEKISPCEVNRDANGAPTYSAIKKGCDMFDSKDQTNIIIMVGTTSDPIKTEKNAALSALINKHVKINFLQTASKDGSMYDTYVKDCKSFLIENAKAFDNKFFAEDLKSGKLKPAKLIPSSTENLATLENSGVPGSFFWVDPGTQIKPTDVSKKIQNLIRENETSINKIIERYEGNTTGGIRGVKDGTEDTEETKQLMAMLMEKGFKPEEINQLANVQNFQLFIEGYASIVNKNLMYPILNRTLFINRNEYNDLVAIFENLNDSYTTSNQRTNIVNTYKEIIKKYKGSASNEVMENFNLNDFMRLVTGLSGISRNPLFKRSLEDIQNDKKTNADDLQKLKSGFNTINKNLKKIKGDKNYRLEQDNETFYWIPESVFHFDN